MFRPILISLIVMGTIPVAFAQVAPESVIDGYAVSLDVRDNYLRIFANYEAGLYERYPDSRTDLDFQKHNVPDPPWDFLEMRDPEAYYPEDDPDYDESDGGTPLIFECDGSVDTDHIFRDQAETWHHGNSPNSARLIMFDLNGNGSPVPIDTRVVSGCVLFFDDDYSGDISDGTEFLSFPRWMGNVYDILGLPMFDTDLSGSFDINDHRWPDARVWNYADGTVHVPADFGIVSFTTRDYMHIPDDYAGTGHYVSKDSYTVDEKYLKAIESGWEPIDIVDGDFRAIACHPHGVVFADGSTSYSCDLPIGWYELTDVTLAKADMSVTDRMYDEALRMYLEIIPRYYLTDVQAMNALNGAGYASHLLGDDMSARKYFEQSLERFPIGNRNAIQGIGLLGH